MLGKVPSVLGVAMANERLRSRIAASNMTLCDVAEKVGVDPKTVERWIQLDRLPHPSHRWTTAKLLETDEAYLWPAAADGARARAASAAELVTLYPHRGTVPVELWQSLLGNASERVEWLACAGLFIADTMPHLLPLLRERAEAGVAVRITLGDPDGEAIARRGSEEGIGDGLAARVRLMLTYLGAQAAVPGVEVRLHDATVYCSTYRFDDDLLVNTHVYGEPAGQSPVLHLRRVEGGRLVDHHQRGFDRIWESARPWRAGEPSRESG